MPQGCDARRPIERGHDGTAEHDTAGPMTKTVADAAIMLDVLAGKSPDPHDAATTACAPPPGGFARNLRAALNGQSEQALQIYTPQSRALALISRR